MLSGDPNFPLNDIYTAIAFFLLYFPLQSPRQSNSELSRTCAPKGNYVAKLIATIAFLELQLLRVLMRGLLLVTMIVCSLSALFFFLNLVSTLRFIFLNWFTIQYSCVFYNEQAGLVSSFQQLETTLERQWHSCPEVTCWVTWVPAEVASSQGLLCILSTWSGWESQLTDLQ